MNVCTEVLSEYAKKQNFFKLAQDQQKEVRYILAEKIDNNLDHGRPCIRYHFEVDGKIYFWDRTSRKLAKRMAEISVGKLILITRTGEGIHTAYVVEELE